MIKQKSAKMQAKTLYDKSLTFANLRNKKASLSPHGLDWQEQ